MHISRAATRPDEDDVDELAFSAFFMTLLFDFESSRIGYNISPVTRSQEKHDWIKRLVTTTVSRLNIPSDRGWNALHYAWFNDGAMLARVRSAATGVWRDIESLDLPPFVAEALVQLLETVASTKLTDDEERQ